MVGPCDNAGGDPGAGAALASTTIARPRADTIVRPRADTDAQGLVDAHAPAASPPAPRPTPR
ncbi:hypothetical protein ABT142_25490 [Streptomyces sp. NPDC001857]|uniref:hypothetical protein n=1 Tax=unclassified Streptomyces TaxID=2593676 RepID=UPI003318521A